MAAKHPDRKIPRPASRPLETLTKIAAQNLDGYFFKLYLLSRTVVRTLREIKGELKTRSQNDKVRKTNRWLLIVLMIFFNLSVLFGWLYYDMRQECNGLIRVEWLYRAVRTMVTNPSAIETMEKEIISGTDEQRESWQTTIMEREQDKKPSPFFHHHDDWKPESPEQKKEQPQPKDTEIDRSIPLPHQTRVRDKEHHKKLNRQLEKVADSFGFARHGHNLTGVSPERAPIAGSA